MTDNRQTDTRIIIYRLCIFFMWCGGAPGDEGRDDLLSAQHAAPGRLVAHLHNTGLQPILGLNYPPNVIDQNFRTCKIATVFVVC